MKKNFLDWSNKKKILNDIISRPYFYEGELWLCSCGVNIGIEQDGKGFEYLRPIIIIKKFNKESLWIVPLSTSQKIGIHYYSVITGVEKPSAAVLSQLRIVDASRLRRKVGKISHNELLEIKEKIKQLLD